MLKKIFALYVIVTLACAAAAQAGILKGKADLVLGQSNFTGNGTGTLTKPRGIAVDTANNRLFVADMNGHRIVWWNDIDGLQNGAQPSGYISGLGLPTGLCVDSGGNLWVADATANSVMRFAPPFTGGANLTITGTGDTSLSAPYSVTIDPSGNLWVADFNHNRILRFAPPFTGAANYVLGQKNFTSTRPNDSNGDNATDNISASTLSSPENVFADATGNIWVADHENHRILRFSPPFDAAANGKDAGLVLGQPDFTTKTNACSVISRTTIGCAYSIFVDAGNNVWVSGWANSRVLRFGGELYNNIYAAQVIGQDNYDTMKVNRGGSTGQDTFNYPSSVAADGAGNLWVVDQANNRVLKFNTIRAGTLDITQWSNSSPVNVTITGEGFEAGTTVKLARTGQPDIPGTNLKVVSDTQITCTFDLTGVQAGTWNLVMTTQGLSSTMNNAMTVLAAKITSVSPSVRMNTGPVEVTVNGENFSQGTNLRLTKAGSPDINASSVRYVNATQLVGTFDIGGAAEGMWNVIIPPGTGDLALNNGLEIRSVKITSCTPLRAANEGPVTLTIRGENLVEGVYPRLRKAGTADIRGANVVMSSSDTITCTMDLLNAATGQWSVQLASGASVGSLNDAFQVYFPSSAVRTIWRNAKNIIRIETAQGIVEVIVPPQTFSEDLAMTVYVPEDAIMPAFSIKDYVTSRLQVSVTTDRQLQPQKNIGVNFFYNDPYVAGLDKGRLAVAYFDGAGTRWLQNASVCHGSRNCVMSVTKHLSLFRVFQRVAERNLGSVTVFPNPYKPNSSSSFADGSMGTGIVFDGLTSDVNIKIFTISGELVRELSENNGDGVVVWDTKNDSGDKVASGVYIYFITNASDDSMNKKGKISVIR